MYFISKNKILDGIKENQTKTIDIQNLQCIYVDQFYTNNNCNKNLIKKIARFYNDMKNLFVCNMLCVFYIIDKYDMIIQKIFSSKIY